MKPRAACARRSARTSPTVMHTTPCRPTTLQTTSRCRCSATC